jgi:hypothetical protein
MLARDAGIGRVSALSVLAGALCGITALEFLIAIAGAAAVAINGGTNFGALGNTEFKTVVGSVLAGAAFGAFVLGGYVCGRMSRRGGATHGTLTGLTGAILVAAIAAAAVGVGADHSLARLARHIGVVDTWGQWHDVAFIIGIVAAAAMVLGAFLGGIQGERWHGRLLARAVDPSFGPEAEQRAEAARRVRDAEVARLTAVDHVARLAAPTSTTSTSALDGVVVRRTAPDVADAPDEVVESRPRRGRHLISRN